MDVDNNCPRLQLLPLQTSSLYSENTVGCESMILQVSGKVRRGSSCSLWPNRLRAEEEAMNNVRLRRPRHARSSHR